MILVSKSSLKIKELSNFFLYICTEYVQKPVISPASSRTPCLDLNPIWPIFCPKLTSLPLRFTKYIHLHQGETGERRSGAAVSMTASYTSTLAEEVVALIRRLHTLPVWNTAVNTAITSQLPNIVSLLAERRTHHVSRCSFCLCL